MGHLRVMQELWRGAGEGVGDPEWKEQRIIRAVWATRELCKSCGVAQVSVGDPEW